MRRVARWTNLSETTFVLAPTAPGVDYRVRIFTPVDELPFAGHPTLGTCRAWLEAGGTPADGNAIVQECAAGLVRVQRDGDRLAFAAPPLVRTGPVDGALVELQAMLRPAEDIALFQADMASWPGLPPRRPWIWRRVCRPAPRAMASRGVPLLTVISLASRENRRDICTTNCSISVMAGAAIRRWRTCCSI